MNNRQLIPGLLASSGGARSAESSAVRFQEYAATLLDKMEAAHRRAQAASRAAKKKSEPKLSGDKRYVSNRVAMTEGEIALAMKLHGEGLSVRTIADRLGRARETVRALIKRGEKPSLRPLLTPAEVEQIERLAAEGYTIPRIAEIMGRPLASVHNRILDWKKRGGRQGGYTDPSRPVFVAEDEAKFFEGRSA